MSGPIAKHCTDFMVERETSLMDEFETLSEKFDFEALALEIHGAIKNRFIHMGEKTIMIHRKIPIKDWFWRDYSVFLRRYTKMGPYKAPEEVCHQFSDHTTLGAETRELFKTKLAESVHLKEVELIECWISPFHINFEVMYTPKV
jgi:hypothetical protein